MGPKMPTALVCYMKEKQPDGDVSSAIRNSLAASLNNGTHNGLNSISSESANLQNQLAATSKLALMSPVDYEEVNSFNNSVQDLKSKYIVLKPHTSSSSTATTAATATATITANTFGCNNASATITSNSSTNTNGKILVNGTSTDKSNNGTASERKGVEFPTPRQILYQREKVRIGWKSSERKWVPGAGMINVGNTCYLNSTLQALFHVPAFANWLYSDKVHRETCEENTGIQGGCIICAMAKTLIASQHPGQQAIKPYLVYTKLRVVCKHMVFGQQEDAHEFLRYLMEAMEKAYLARFPKSLQLDQYSKETTPINQILGGYLKTSVRCLACNHESVTFQHFEDLLLDIRKANTLEEALDLYFARERLEDMGYKCESCKKKVSATKQFSLERAPISLCIQLKRFSIVGNKLNKHIAIRQHLNLSKYSSRKNSHESLQYRLVSMVTHLGASQHCGHYTAIGLTDTGSYYQFDDSYVRQISIQNVLNTNAYIIFYELDTSAAATTTTTVAAATSLKMTDKLYGPTNMDRISTTADDQISRSFLDTKELPRNQVTTTITSGGSNATKPFIGPLLPSKLNNDSNESTASSHSDKDSILSTNKSINSPKKSEHSPIVKLTSNGARYVTQNTNETNVNESSSNKFVQNNGYLPLSNSNSKNESSSSSDDDDDDDDGNDCDGDRDDDNDGNEDDDDDDGDDDNDASDSDNASAANGRHKQHKSVLKRKHSSSSSNNKEQTLPSMPKLETNEVINHSEKNSLKVRSLVNGSMKMQNGTNGKIVRTNNHHHHKQQQQHNRRDDDSDSDSSCDDHAIAKKSASIAKHSIPKSSNSTPVLLFNGNNKMTTNRLVPYDDSEYDSGNESPPEVKTKAGPFTVTSTNTNTPPVVSSFLRKSKTPSPARTINNSTVALSNGAKLLESRRESDSNMVVKTAASTVNSNKRPNEWHGNEAKHKLMKLSHRGYGGAVSSWNGQKSAMEKEVNDEKNQELKRQSLSGNDAEMDRGHKKKTGSKLVLGRDNPGYNPFQESQNQRNTWTISNGNNGSNSNASSHRPFKPQIYRQNPKPKYHHKFNRNTGNGGRHFSNSYRQHNNYNRQLNK